MVPRPTMVRIARNTQSDSGKGLSELPMRGRRGEERRGAISNARRHRDGGVASRQEGRTEQHGSHQVVADGPGNRRSAGPNLQFAKDIGDVVVDGAAAEKKRIGDVLTGVAIREQSQHLQFARREPGDMWIRYDCVGRAITGNRQQPVEFHLDVHPPHAPAGIPGTFISIVTQPLAQRAHRFLDDRSFRQRMRHPVTLRFRGAEEAHCGFIPPGEFGQQTSRRQHHWVNMLKSGRPAPWVLPDQHCRSLGVSLLARDERKAGRAPGLNEWVAEFSGRKAGGVQHAPCSFQVAKPVRPYTQVEIDDDLGPGVVACLVQHARLAEPHPSFAVSATIFIHRGQEERGFRLPGKIVERLRLLVRPLEINTSLYASKHMRYLPRPPQVVLIDRPGPVASELEHSLVQGNAFGFVPAEIPEPSQVGDEVCQVINPAVGVQPGQGRPEVGMFPFEQIDGAELAGWIEWGRRTFRQGETPLRMPVPDFGLFPTVDKPRQPEIPDRFQHREARFAAGLFDRLDQALLDERVDTVHRSQR